MDEWYQNSLITPAASMQPFKYIYVIYVTDFPHSKGLIDQNRYSGNQLRVSQVQTLGNQCLLQAQLAALSRQIPGTRIVASFHRAFSPAFCIAPTSVGTARQQVRVIDGC